VYWPNADPLKLVPLRGDLGAGKTTLVKGTGSLRGRLRGRRHQPHLHLIHEYRGPQANPTIDLYRIDTPRQWRLGP
jgi:tRNA threonylcarbamoyladenosine biosynthesis protein TsaE